MSHCTQNSSGKIRGILKVDFEDSDECDLKFEANEVQFIPVEIHDEKSHSKHSRSYNQKVYPVCEEKRSKSAACKMKVILETSETFNQFVFGEYVPLCKPSNLPVCKVRKKQISKKNLVYPYNFQEAENPIRQCCACNQTESSVVKSAGNEYPPLHEESFGESLNKLSRKSYIKSNKQTQLPTKMLIQKMGIAETKWNILRYVPIKEVSADKKIRFSIATKKEEKFISTLKDEEAIHPSSVEKLEELKHEITKDVSSRKLNDQIQSKTTEDAPETDLSIGDHADNVATLAHENENINNTLASPIIHSGFEVTSETDILNSNRSEVTETKLKKPSSLDAQSIKGTVSSATRDAEQAPQGTQSDKKKEDMNNKEYRFGKNENEFSQMAMEEITPGIPETGVFSAKSTKQVNLQNTEYVQEVALSLEEHDKYLPTFVLENQKSSGVIASLIISNEFEDTASMDTNQEKIMLPNSLDLLKAKTDSYTPERIEIKLDKTAASLEGTMLNTTMKNSEAPQETDINDIEKKDMYNKKHPITVIEKESTKTEFKELMQEIPKTMVSSNKSSNQMDLKTAEDTEDVMSIRERLFENQNNADDVIYSIIDGELAAISKMTDTDNKNAKEEQIVIKTKLKESVLESSTEDGIGIEIPMIVATKETGKAIKATYSQIESVEPERKGTTSPSPLDKEEDIQNTKDDIELQRNDNLEKKTEVNPFILLTAPASNGMDSITANAELRLKEPEDKREDKQKLTMKTHDKIVAYENKNAGVHEDKVNPFSILATSEFGAEIGSKKPLTQIETEIIKIKKGQEELKMIRFVPTSDERSLDNQKGTDEILKIASIKLERDATIGVGKAASENQIRQNEEPILKNEYVGNLLLSPSVMDRKVSSEEEVESTEKAKAIKNAEGNIERGVIEGILEEISRRFSNEKEASGSKNSIEEIPSDGDNLENEVLQKKMEIKKEETKPKEKIVEKEEEEERFKRFGTTPTSGEKKRIEDNLSVHLKKTVAKPELNKAKGAKMDASLNQIRQDEEPILKAKFVGDLEMSPLVVKSKSSIDEDLEKVKSKEKTLVKTEEKIELGVIEGVLQELSKKVSMGVSEPESGRAEGVEIGVPEKQIHQDKGAILKAKYVNDLEMSPLAVKRKSSIDEDLEKVNSKEKTLKKTEENIELAFINGVLQDISKKVSTDLDTNDGEKLLENTRGYSMGVVIPEHRGAEGVEMGVSENQMNTDKEPILKAEHANDLEMSPPVTKRKSSIDEDLEKVKSKEKTVKMTEENILGVRQDVSEILSSRKVSNDGEKLLENIEGPSKIIIHPEEKSNSKNKYVDDLKISHLVTKRKISSEEGSKEESKSKKRKVEKIVENIEQSRSDISKKTSSEKVTNEGKISENKQKMIHEGIAKKIQHNKIEIGRKEKPSTPTKTEVRNVKKGEEESKMLPFIPTIEEKILEDHHKTEKITEKEVFGEIQKEISEQNQSKKETMRKTIKPPIVNQKEIHDEEVLNNNVERSKAGNVTDTSRRINDKESIVTNIEALRLTKEQELLKIQRYAPKLNETNKTKLISTKKLDSTSLETLDESGITSKDLQQDGAKISNLKDKKKTPFKSNILKNNARGGGMNKNSFSTPTPTSSKNSFQLEKLASIVEAPNRFRKTSEFKRAKNLEGKTIGKPESRKTSSSLSTHNHEERTRIELNSKLSPAKIEETQNEDVEITKHPGEDISKSGESQIRKKLSKLRANQTQLSPSILNHGEEKEGSHIERDFQVSGTNETQFEANEIIVPLTEYSPKDNITGRTLDKPRPKQTQFSSIQNEQEERHIEGDSQVSETNKTKSKYNKVNQERMRLGEMETKTADDAVDILESPKQRKDEDTRNDIHNKPILDQVKSDRSTTIALRFTHKCPLQKSLDQRTLHLIDIDLEGKILTVRSHMGTNNNQEAEEKVSKFEMINNPTNKYVSFSKYFTENNEEEEEEEVASIKLCDNCYVMFESKLDEGDNHETNRDDFKLMGEFKGNSEEPAIQVYGCFGSETTEEGKKYT
ncbi:hypothetical protein HHI36_014066 [Cryptolaemus montrouzieri]|uniref:Uncharacterized protein n=1 Tax=Cryptolaemus montrouzieri TaxID=559131 RepID=A0ABD2N1P4_9CUCU